jgi:hypothetical protein
VPEYEVESPAAELNQLLDRGLTGRPHRGEDPAPRRGDLLVGGPRQAPRELVLARAGEQEVRVRVDEPRQDDPAPGVDPPRPTSKGQRAGRPGLRPHPDDPPVRRGEGPVAHHAEGPLAEVWLEREELSRAGHEQIRGLSCRHGSAALQAPMDGRFRPWRRAAAMASG